MADLVRARLRAALLVMLAAALLAGWSADAHAAASEHQDAATWLVGVVAMVIAAASLAVSAMGLKQSSDRSYVERLESQTRTVERELNEARERERHLETQIRMLENERLELLRRLVGEDGDE